MKQILLIIVLIATGAFQCYSQSGCDCWQQAFTGHEMNYEATFSELESDLIQQGYLRNATPESYYLLADSAISENIYLLSGVHFNPLLLEKFGDCFLFTSCDQSVYPKFLSFLDQVAGYKNISPALLYSDFKDTFTLDDLNQVEVKHFFLTFFGSLF